MGLSPEQINAIASTDLARERLSNTAIEQVFRRAFDVQQAGRIEGRFETQEDRLERRLGSDIENREAMNLDRDTMNKISDRSTSVAEKRLLLDQQLRKKGDELRAAQVLGHKATTQLKQLEIDAIEELLGEDETRQETLEAIAGVSKGGVAAESLEFRKEQAIRKSEETLGIHKDKEAAPAGHARFVNESFASEGIPFMWVWKHGFFKDNEWTKIQIPSGYTYNDVVKVAIKRNKSHYEVIQKMGE